MANTASLAKASSPQAKNAVQKVIKLAKSSASKKLTQASLSAARTKNTDNITRATDVIVEVKPKNKAMMKSEKKHLSKTQKEQGASKRASSAVKPAHVQKRTAVATALGTVNATVIGKAVPHQKIVQALDKGGKAKIPSSKLQLLSESNTTKQNSKPESKAVRLLPSDIKVFQIYYLPEHQEHLDPDFTPYDNSGNTSRLFEFSVFTKLAQSNEAKNAKLWGAMSWKFGKKASTSGRQLKDEILAHPGYDAYYINPFPENEALFHNMWLQGELAHPNFMPLCTEIFEVAGLPTELLNSVQPSSEFSAANYFVANQAFWRAYIGFISRILINADKNLSPTAKRIFYSSTADKFGAHSEASYIPFIIERLFTVFLHTEGKKFRTFKLKLEEHEKKSNVHLKLLSEMKDVACRTKSTWLAACWINYRNLYLSKLYGEGWVKGHLKQITPPNIVFMPETAALAS